MKLKEYSALDGAYPEDCRKNRNVLRWALGGMAAGAACVAAGLIGVTPSEIINPILVGSGEVGGAVATVLFVNSCIVADDLEERRVEGVEWAQDFREQHLPQEGSVG